MTTPELVAPKFVDMKSHPTINEQWLHNRLIDNPGLLGLGDLEVRSSERRQPSGGRLDLLLEDTENRIRYEVEIQLGELDESHIIRTIEYWDIERRRYPQYDHIAVIVAEDVTSRFLNVISLFNGAIPLIAIQIKGVSVNDLFTLVATRVVDLAVLGTVEEDEGEIVDRGFWEGKASPSSLQIVDDLIELTRGVQPNVNPKYTKHYIGLDVGGQSRNFLVLRPRKASNVLTDFKVPQSEELTGRLSETGLSLSYDTRNRRYRIRISQQDLSERRHILIDLINKARDAHFGQ